MESVFPTRAFLLIPLAAANLLAQSSETPKHPGFDLKAMDPSADPCANFYQYACGGWIAQNPIPSDRGRWGRFDELQERNLAVLQNILEKAASTSHTRTAEQQKIGDYYASCMDQAAVDKLGAQPIEPELKQIDAIADKQAIEEEVIRLNNLGVPVFFRFGANPDAKNSSMEIADLRQGGITLPDRDYYLKDDAKSVQLREKYLAHVNRMFELLGDDAGKAAAAAKTVMDFETTLAKGSLDRVSLRDPDKNYHKMTVGELKGLAPFLDWPKFFEGVTAPEVSTLNVAQPDFFRALTAAINQASLDDLKTYLRWHYLRAKAPLLSQPFVDENFGFFGKALTGAKEIRPRWKRCVEQTDLSLGEVLGKFFVDEAFSPEAKVRTLRMVHEIEKEMSADLKDLPWMTPETKKQAYVKLEAVANKIAYPDHWRDYNALQVTRGDSFGNANRAVEFDVHRRLRKIGKAVDRKEWGMTPPTVNAYFSPPNNDINFPAGILQPPFYDAAQDDAPNYGGIGAVVGHELTHGFDDQGRKYDAKGNLQDWWTPEDAKEFEKRAECLIKEYSSFEPVPGVHLNGKLTLGENTADNGGVRLAFMALMDSLKGKEPPKIDGFTPEQRFFLGYGQIWCQRQTEETSRLRAATDPHSPGEFRVNGVVSNMPEFQKAFACHEGQPMVREPACRVW